MHWPPPQAPHVVALPGGGGAVAWDKDTLTVNSEIVPDNFLVIYGMNAHGGFIWRHEWLSSRYRVMTSLNSCANGDILGSGFRDGGNFPNKGKGLLFRMSPQGELIWEHHYSDSLIRPWASHMELLEVCEMADGRIAATGIVFDWYEEGGRRDPNVVVLVLGPDGCLEPGCEGELQYITSVSEPIIKGSALPRLVVSPVPSSGPMQVLLPEALAGGGPYELRCYSADGRLLRRERWPWGSSSLLLNDWSEEGLFYVHLFDSRGYPVATGKGLFQR